MDLDLHQIRGRLGADPEVRYTKGNTAVANISVATSRQYKKKDGEKKEETTWHRVVLWGRKAEIAQEYLSKGDMVYISGHTQINEWEDKDGNPRRTKEIVANRLDMLGSSGGNSSGNGSSNGSDQMDSNTDLDEDFDDIDDDLPF